MTERPSAQDAPDMHGAFRSPPSPSKLVHAFLPASTLNYLPPALTLPGGRGGKRDRKPRRGKEARGVGCFPVLWGVKPLLPQNPQFLVLQRLTGGRPPVFPHTFFP